MMNRKNRRETRNMFLCFYEINWKIEKYYSIKMSNMSSSCVISNGLRINMQLSKSFLKVSFIILCIPMFYKY
jgi:hypothetical protein